MPYKFESMPINNPKHDRRVKLTDEDRVKIVEEYKTELISQRKLAEKYRVSRRLISFIINPEKYEQSKKQFAERQKDGRYYDREKHREYMRRHRQHKKKLYQEGLLKEND